MEQIEWDIENIHDQFDEDQLFVSREERLAYQQPHSANILRQIEKYWHLKSMVVWLEVGDCNTKFFHKFSNQRRITNYIWELKNENGYTINDQRTLKLEFLN